MTRQPLFVSFLCALLVGLLGLTPGAFGQSIDMRLPDGSRWRGEVGDHVRMTVLERRVEVDVEGRITENANLYLVLEGDYLSGRTKTIFKADILSIETIDPEARSDSQQRSRRAADRAESDAEAEAASDTPGVIVLPLRGGVGVEIRKEEFAKVRREADRLGRGQIIVLDIDTGGGSLAETFQIAEIMMDIKKRHRLIAWVRPKAISAGNAIASLCHEIYFTQDGNAGAMTGFNPATMKALQDEGLEMWLRKSGEWMESGGRSPYIAHAMIVAERELSYDKDPVTGRVTFYPNLSGEFVLSTNDRNLSLTAHEAVHCGYANGIANTHEELARLLDMPKWNEASDVGRRSHQEWMDTVERCRDRVQRLGAQMQRGVIGDQLANLNHQLQIIRELISWWDRAPNVVGSMGVPRKEALEAQERELRKQIADIRRQRR